MTDKLSADLASLRIDRSAPAQSATDGSKRFVWPAAVVVGLLGVCAAGWFVLPNLTKPFLKKEVKLTTVALISPSQAAVNVAATGYVVPQRTAKIGSKIPGRILKVNIKEGDRVKAGDVLFELDAQDQKIALSSARARASAARARSAAAWALAKEAQQKLEREKRLVASGATAAATADDLDAHYTALKANAGAVGAEAVVSQTEIQQMQAALENMKIVAPFDGRIVSRPLEAGSVVNQEVVLVELADFDSLLIETDVSESHLRAVKLGAPCEATFDADTTKRYRCEVSELHPRLNRSKASAMVKVRLTEKFEDGVVLAEMSARVNFLSKPLSDEDLTKQPKKVVPVTAVVDRGGAKFVYVIDDGEKARETPVTLGEQSGGTVELTSGPRPGAKLVDAPPPDLRDGQSIKEQT